MTGLMRMKRKTLFRSPAPVAFLKMASQLKAVKSYIGLGIIVGVLTGCATGGVKMLAEYPPVSEYLSRDLIEVNTYRGRAKREVKAYSVERKEAVLRRMMPHENKTVSALARETGITEQTLYTWRRQLKSRGMPVPGDGKNPEGWSSEDKFAVVLETAALNEAELAEYCRRKGLYAEQIAAWRGARGFYPPHGRP